MRSIIKQEVIKEEYYLAKSFIRGTYFGIWGNQPELDVENPYLVDLGVISLKRIHLEFATIYETDNLNRELVKGEAIDIYGDNYHIAKVSHAVDGSIIYYVTENKCIKDEKSYDKAKKAYEDRDAFVVRKLAEVKQEEKEKEEKKKEEIMKDELPIIPVANSKRKWYEFWKIEDGE